MSEIQTLHANIRQFRCSRHRPKACQEGLVGKSRFFAILENIGSLFEIAFKVGCSVSEGNANGIHMSSFFSIPKHSAYLIFMTYKL